MGAKRRRVRRVVGRVVVAAIVLSLTATLPLRWIDPPTSAFMLRARMAASGERRADPAIRYRWVDRDSIAPCAGIAVVASEDQKFPRHHGFDTDELANAVREWRRGERTRGASREAPMARSPRPRKGCSRGRGWRSSSAAR